MASLVISLRRTITKITCSIKIQGKISKNEKLKMSQDQFNKNSEYDSEFESEYEDSRSDSEYEESESGSDYDNENNVKRRKTEDNCVPEVVFTDENGHVKCHPGHQLGQFEVEAVLGEGAYGRVMRAKNVSNGQSVALKVIKNDQTKRKAAMAEIIALTMLSCRDPSDRSFCIKMHSWFTYAGHVCIAFPVLGVSVFDFLSDNDFEPYSNNEVRHISYQLCSAVQFLHKNGMTHTDLKPENILFVNSSYTTVYNAATNSEFRQVNCTNIRLIDFGNVTRDSDYHHPIISTRYYRAPEIILRLDWTHSCDIWSIGCILIEIYFGNLLFPTHADREHLGMMEKTLGPIPMQMVNASNTAFFKNGKLDWNWNDAEADAEEHCRPLKEFQLRDCEDDDQLFCMIEQMLAYEPNRRLPLSAALDHPFFKDLPSHQRIAKNKIR